MPVTTTDYGTFKTHTGTLAEVAGAMKGIPATHIISVFYDTDNNLYVAIQKSGV